MSFYVTLALCVAMSCGMLVSLTPNKNRSYEQPSGYYLVIDAEGRQYRISADEVAQKEAEWQNGDVELRPLKYGEVESVNPGAIAHFIGTADMFIGIFAVVKHKDNIKRLRNGEEKKIRAAKNEPEKST